MSTIFKPRPKQVHRRVSNPLFKLTKSEAMDVNRPILNSLKRMVDGISNGTDWYNIMFFLMVGDYLVKNFYTQETIDEFSAVYKVCESIEEKSKLTEYKNWVVSVEVQHDLTTGIETVILLQEQTLRLDVLKAHRNAKEQIQKKYIKRQITDN
jgi:hypothetical protein